MAVVLRWQEAKLLVAKAYRHTEQVLQENLDKLQAVRLGAPGCPGSILTPRCSREGSRHRAAEDPSLRPPRPSLAPTSLGPPLSPSR